MLRKPSFDTLFHLLIFGNRREANPLAVPFCFSQVGGADEIQNANEECGRISDQKERRLVRARRHLKVVRKIGTPSILDTPLNMARLFSGFVFIDFVLNFRPLVAMTNLSHNLV